jgi:hypothetical protein
MFAIILFMYSCGMVNFALNVWMFLSFPDVSMRAVLITLVLGFITVRHSLLSAPRVLRYVQVFLSDCIVVWRAWILWKRCKVILVASVTLLLGALGASLFPVCSQRIQHVPQFPLLRYSPAPIFAKCLLLPTQFRWS